MTAKEAIKKLKNYKDQEEPVFILRGQDPLSGVVARLWASLYQARTTEEYNKGMDALTASRALDEWPIKRRAD